MQTIYLLIEMHGKAVRKNHTWVFAYIFSRAVGLVLFGTYWSPSTSPHMEVTAALLV